VASDTRFSRAPSESFALPQLNRTDCSVMRRRSIQRAGGCAETNAAFAAIMLRSRLPRARPSRQLALTKPGISSRPADRVRCA
jgi:hypothetical protein